MKKTNIRIPVLFFALLSLLCGCEKFLNPSPEASYTVEDSYRTQSDFEYAINGVYQAQQLLYSRADCWFRVGIIRSDEVRAGQGGSSCKGISLCINDANVPILVTAWQYFWQIITRANVILTRIDGVDFQSEEVRKQIKGQAYALRAWAYYNLAWQFGGMPLIDRQLTLAQDYSVARSTQEQTLEFAADDYRKAIGLLPEKWTGTNVGRITRYAAMGGLARLHMFRSEFSSAAFYLKQIIGSGLYAMEEDYQNCFSDKYDNGSERLWEIQFIPGNLGQGTEFPSGLLPENYNKECKDDGSMLMPFNGYATAIMISQDHMDAYEPGDKRMAVSTVQNLNIAGKIEVSYSYIRKYLHYDVMPTLKNDWACNLPVMRYTDVLMLYAECLNEAGYNANGQAFEILNKVRSRAGLSPQTPEQLPDREAFREAIKAERRVEFAFEGLRWQDLVRWNEVEEVMNAHFSTKDNGGGLYQMKPYHRLYAIPFTEISRYNDKKIMWQNEGY